MTARSTAARPVTVRSAPARLGTARLTAARFGTACRAWIGALGALAVFAAFAAPPAVAAGDATAGRAKAEPCAACHGANGVSVSPDIPNLAAQKVDYLAAQLEAFRAGMRASDIMNPIAAELSDTDIADLAAFWNGLPGANGDAVSELVPAINETRVAFPEGYEASYVRYATIDFPDRKQVRRYLANPVAVAAARAGEPMPEGAFFLVEAYAAKLDADGNPVTGADDHFAPAKLAFYTAMARGPGWGEAIPALYRNGDWNYAVFSPEGEVKRGVNHAKCLACHKPLAEDSYLFTLDALIEKAKE